MEGNIDIEYHQKDKGVIIMNANETTGSIGRMWKKTTEGESSCGKAIVPCIADSECQAFCSVPATRMSRPHHVYLCPSCPPCSSCPPFLTCPPSNTCPPCSQCQPCLPCPTFPPCAPGLRPSPSKVLQCANISSITLLWLSSPIYHKWTFLHVTVHCSSK